ncbi:MULTISPECIES: TetR/AcrR family transcriptional regulator [unclassified Sphingomonas]|uniref:TetR/AcrR family transcriptional regulator n=1 Tax=unclassified Sphingomonas TaxID=196159 RepID=UPI0006FCCAAF|nr:MULTISPECIES: TetR/AcrR family transcriptional regulator [unclassified Sphingomonas]KQX23308.1 TetR family transcriptional regulator [Sphingomonas sp. Root1294]KQY68156.1 TetR family transcriptional regulator [Sphingomonas sp. Root50]KRB91049.1 TetR family transcriptional regulator [Sphingomonas sp. Root720]
MKDGASRPESSDSAKPVRRKAKTAARSSRLNPVQLARRVEVGEQRRAKSRHKLMQAAYRLFAVHGAEAPTIDDVIAEAKVARGTFYNHFKSRDELFRAVGNDVSFAINSVISGAIDGMENPIERIVLFFRLFVRFAVADSARGWILLRTMPLAGPLNAGAKDFIAAEFEAAFQTGRLRRMPMAVAIDLGLGMQIMTIHRVLVEKVGNDHIDLAAEGMAIALGLDAAEARRLASLPIKDDEGPKPAVGRAYPLSAEPA